MIFAPPKLILTSLIIVVYNYTTATGLPIPQSPAEPPAIDTTITTDVARVLPVVNMPLATQFSAHQDENSSSGAVISSAFAYSNTSSSYPGVRVPPGWSFSLGLLHPFVYPEGISIDKPLYHSASLADGSLLPPWLLFDNYTVTFNGVTPLVTSDQKNALLQIKLMASDIFGSQDVAQGFNLTVGTHTLDTIATQERVKANVTAGYPTVIPWTAFQSIRLDGKPLSVENTSSIAIGAKELDWITFDKGTLDVHISPPASMIGRHVAVPMEVIDIYGGQVVTETIVQIEAYAFKRNETEPAVLGGQQFLEGHAETDAILVLDDYLTQRDNAGLDFELMSRNGHAEEDWTLDVKDGGLILKGRYLPSYPNGSVQIPMVIIATNRTSRATSSLSFSLDFTSSTAQPGNGRHHLGSGALAAIGVTIGIVLIMAILLLLFFFIQRKKLNDESVVSSLGMRNSALLGPEKGIFSGNKRSDRFSEFGHYERDKPVDDDSKSTNETVQGAFFENIQPRISPSSSSLIVRLGQSAENLAHKLSRVLGLEPKGKTHSNSNDTISRPTVVGHGSLSVWQENTLSSSSGIPNLLPSHSSNSNLLGAELFTVVTDIAKRISADSTSTVFTNFSKDTELWGKSDHEEESNFSQTPSHHRPSRLAGTPRSGADTNDISPSIQDSHRSGSDESPDYSPTPRRGYVQGRVLNTITEDFSREGYSTGSSLKNPLGPTDNMSSIGTIQIAERTMLGNATPEQIIMGNNRHLRYGSDHVLGAQLSVEQHSMAASLEPALGSSNSGENGDVGSILNQTSFEGFKARDSVTADAEESDILTDAGPHSALHTSIASHTRSVHTLLGDNSTPRMISSRRTGSCSTLAVVTSSHVNHKSKDAC